MAVDAEKPEWFYLYKVLEVYGFPIKCINMNKKIYKSPVMTATLFMFCVLKLLISLSLPSCLPHPWPYMPPAPLPSDWCSLLFSGPLTPQCTCLPDWCGQSQQSNQAQLLQDPCHSFSPGGCLVAASFFAGRIFDLLY